MFKALFNSTLNFDDGPKMAKKKDITRLSSVVDRVEIFQMKTLKRKSVWEKSIELNNRGDLSTFFSFLKIIPPKDVIHWRSLAQYSFHCYAGEKQICTIGYLDPDYIRWSGYWKGDCQLKSMSLMYWLANKGINGPLDAFNKKIEEHEKAEKETTALLQGSPKALHPNLLRNELPIEEIAKNLESEISDPQKRILGLFNLLGSSTTPWNYYSNIESLANQLLKKFNPNDLLGAIRFEKMSNAEIEGMARFLGGNFPLSQGESDAHKIPNDIAQEVERRMSIQYPRRNFNSSKNK